MNNDKSLYGLFGIPKATLNIVFINILVFTLFSVFLIHNSSNHLNGFKQYEKVLSKNSLQNIAHTIENHLSQKEDLVRGFIADHIMLFQQVIQDPESKALDELNIKLKKYFPDFHSFNISDEEETLLIDDFDGNRGPLCEVDLQSFVVSGQNNERIHPNAVKYHYDINDRIYFKNHTFYIAMSFDTSFLSKILKNAYVPNHQFILSTPVNQKLLIEVNATGNRHDLIQQQQPVLVNKAHILNQQAVAGTHWILVDVIPEDFYAQVEHSQWEEDIKILIFVLVLLALFGWKSIRDNQSIRQVNGRLNQALTESKKLEGKAVEAKQKNRAILENIIDSVIVIDAKGIIQTVNDATTKLFGYEVEELVGQNIKMLMPESFAIKHDQYLANYRETGQEKIIGKGREVVAKRQDDSEFPIELSVGRMDINGEIMFTGIIRDITERKEAEKMKAEFISTVSHELRTPLTSIRGSIGLLKGGAAGELTDKAEQLLNIAHNNTERLLLLINDILDISKIEAGKMDFKFAPVNVTEAVEQAIENNTGYAEQHQVSYVLENHINNQFIYADAGRFQQIMGNLMSNAAKFANPNSQVIISLAQREHQVRISVTDYGKGIPETLKPTIFEKFTQADSTDTRQTGGTGLGLNITKLMVEKHNGIIGFESTENIGTTFYIDLPLHIPAGEGQEHSSGLSKLNTQQSKVLICEDDKDIAALLKLMLTQGGMDADVAYSAAEAKALLSKQTYLAMTLDIMLPDTDGKTFYDELRQLPEFKDLPIIFVSAKANQLKMQMLSEDDSLANNSAVEWENKPISEERLLKFLNKSIQNQQKGTRVLHVEDDLDIQQLISMLLGEEQYQIDTQATLKNARIALMAKKYDVVILDIGLPDGSGLDLLPILKKEHPATKVIIFSADDYKLSGVNDVAASLLKSKVSNEDIKQAIEEASQ